jgi:hypothetical protein
MMRPRTRQQERAFQILDEINVADLEDEKAGTLVSIALTGGSAALDERSLTSQSAGAKSSD